MENNQRTINALESTVVDTLFSDDLNAFDTLHQIFDSSVCASLWKYNIVDKLYGFYLRELVDRLDSIQVVGWAWQVHNGRCVLEIIITEDETLSFTLVWDLKGDNTHWSMNCEPISLTSDILHLLGPVSVTLDFGLPYVHRPLFHLGCVTGYLTIREAPITLHEPIVDNSGNVHTYLSRMESTLEPSIVATVKLIGNENDRDRKINTRCR